MGARRGAKRSKRRPPVVGKQGWDGESEAAVKARALLESRGRPPDNPLAVGAKPARWWRIVAPHFVAVVIVERGRVTDSAPILAWTRGRRWRSVRADFRRRGWHGAPV